RCREFAIAGLAQQGHQPRLRVLSATCCRLITKEAERGLSNNRRLVSLAPIQQVPGWGIGVSGFCKCVHALLSRLRRYSAAALMLVVALGAGAASAQELSADERAKLLAQKEALFQQMLR